MPIYSKDIIGGKWRPYSALSKIGAIIQQPRVQQYKPDLAVITKCTICQEKKGLICSTICTINEAKTLLERHRACRRARSVSQIVNIEKYARNHTGCNYIQ